MKIQHRILIRFAALLVVFCIFAPAVFGQTPRYKVYVAPFPDMGGDGSEPSIGINLATGNVMYQAGLETLRIQFNDSTSPAMTTWTMTQPLLTSLFSLDPILFTDPQTNRTFVSQLDAACSLTEYTDDDGESWHLSVGCGVPAGIDHQSIGGGPYTSNPPPHSNYPNAVYYCSQNLLAAICSRSDNGGFIFGLGVPIYLFLQCGGRHGRIEVGPDGTVYVPNSACGNKQGVAVSQNNGLTWQVRKIPTSSSAASDPSIGIGSGNRVYFGYQSGDGKPRIAISNDRGLNWLYDQNVGASHGINNVVFPAVVAGDNDRAAFAFLGTTKGGNFQSANFTGTWHLYVATTFNGGQSWSTVKVTEDPVQVGPINIQAGIQPSGRRFTINMSSPLLDRGSRNLLDFIDIGIDANGRVLVAYADGCVGECVSSPSASLSRSGIASIARQSGGKRLLAAFDPVEPSKPAAPLVLGNREEEGIRLAWEAPDHGGLPVTKYKIYRRTSSTSYEPLKTVKTGTTYLDKKVEEGFTYYYQVRAINSKGKSPYSNEVEIQ